MLLPATNEIKIYIEDTVSFANKINKQENLLQCLYRLGHGWYNNGREYVCILTKDWAPYSFGFACFDLKNIQITGHAETGEVVYTIRNGAKPFLVGGLIYHGGNEETYSIQINPTDGWSIHT